MIRHLWAPFWAACTLAILYGTLLYSAPNLRHPTAIFPRGLSVRRRLLSESETGDSALDTEESVAEPPSMGSAHVEPSLERQVGETDNKLGLSDSGVRPVSVMIGDKKFYGGLETIYHRLMSTQLCKIYNPCLRHDGTLVLPKWMVRHDDMLENLCGVKAVEFSLPDSIGPPTKPLPKLDLFGIETPRLHAPSFLMDFLPTMVAMHALHGEHKLTRKCLSRKGKKCKSLPDTPAKSLRPAVLVDERMQNQSEKDSWAYQMIRASTPKTSKAAKLLTWRDLFPNGEKSALRCVRSAFVMRLPKKVQKIKPQLLEQLTVFTRSGANRAPRQVTLDGRASLDGMPALTCRLNLTIINRKPDAARPNRIIGRYIPNIPQLRTELQKLSDVADDVELSVAAIRMEGRSLRWQINAMQKTDILVGGHGAPLANMIFMRAGSGVFELQPFAYYHEAYEALARSVANLRYDMSIAKPDPVAFDACVRHHYPAGDPARRAALAVLARFRKAVADYGRSTKNTHSITLQNVDARLARVRVCANMQALSNDAATVAAEIFSLARAACQRP